MSPYSPLTVSRHATEVSPHSKPARRWLRGLVAALALLFVIYGLFSRWVHTRTASPAVAAIANALVFGWFIALTFPLVA